MAFLVTSPRRLVRPPRDFASTAVELAVRAELLRQRAGTRLVCRWVPEAGSEGRLVSRWVAEPNVTDPCSQIAVINTSGNRAVA